MGCFPNDYVGLVVKLEAFSLLEKFEEREQKKQQHSCPFAYNNDAIKVERGMKNKALSEENKGKT